MADAPPITVKMQAWVYFVTWVQYAANHITRKCYTNVKNVMIAMGLSKETLGRMDAGFMFTYAFGAPLAGQLGDMYHPSKILGVGLYGLALCIFLLIFGMWNGFYALGEFVSSRTALLLRQYSMRAPPAPPARGGVVCCCPSRGR